MRTNPMCGFNFLLVTLRFFFCIFIHIQSYFNVAADRIPNGRFYIFSRSLARSHTHSLTHSGMGSIAIQLTIIHNHNSIFEMFIDISKFRKSHFCCPEIRTRPKAH